MKKIISMILCLVFATLALAGCGNDGVGEDLDDSMKGYEKESITLNFYIVGDTTNDNPTVNARINNYTTKHFNTTLNIVYCNEDNYENTVVAALDAAKAALAAVEEGATDEATLNAIKNKPDFFLINSPQMMKTLYEKGHLADLTEFFYPEIYEKKVEIYPDLMNKFHLELIKKTEGLHNQITETLMDASVIYETKYNQETKKDITEEKNYCVPNNRIVGSYTYLIIDKAAAREVYMGTNSMLNSFTLKNKDELIEAIAEAKGLTTEAVKENYVRVIYDGKYEDKAMYEANGFACNIVEYPQVAGLEATDPDVNIPETVDNVFNSAFVVGAYSDVDRAMEIIYALNTDNILHNYLQYGVQDTNYTIDQETGLVTYEQITNEDNKYFMNPIYTGDMFKLLPSETWTETDMLNAKKQNDQSVLYKSNND